MNSPGRRPLRRQFGALAGACLMNGSVDGALWPRLPQVRQQIGASVDEWALIMTLASVAAVFALVAGSAASARLGITVMEALAGWKLSCRLRREVTIGEIYEESG